jgi:hypothetical protein
VYAIDPETGVETKLNSSRIAAERFAIQGIYELPVAGVSLGDERTFRIEEIELTGKVRDLGVHTVVFDVPVAKVALASALQQVEPVVEPLAMVPSPELKVLVSESGVVGVPFEDIAEGMGVALLEIESLASNSNVRVSSQGQPVGVAFTNQMLLFRGEPVQDFYTDEQAYWITQGSALIDEVFDPLGVSREITNVFEDNAYPYDSTHVEPDDFF